MAERFRQLCGDKLDHVGDFLGAPRRSGEPDDLYRERIRDALTERIRQARPIDRYCASCGKELADNESLACRLCTE
jgi:hypothetical protein